MELDTTIETLDENGIVSGVAKGTMYTFIRPSATPLSVLSPAAQFATGAPVIELKFWVFHTPEDTVYQI